MSNVLTGEIPGLLRPCAPVVKTWNAGYKDKFTAKGIVLEQLASDIAGERWRCWFDHPRIGMDVGFPPDLDLTTRLGRFVAMEWLREHGHDLHQMEDSMHAAELLAWSVLSVNRGGKPIAGVLGEWFYSAYAISGHQGASHAGFVRRGVLGNPVSVQVWATPDQTNPERLRCPWGWLFGHGHAQGPDTGETGKDCVDRHALTTNYALANPDGSILLPPLPEAPCG